MEIKGKIYLPCISKMPPHIIDNPYRGKCYMVSQLQSKEVKAGGYGAMNLLHRLTATS